MFIQNNTFQSFGCWYLSLHKFRGINVSITSKLLDLLLNVSCFLQLTIPVELPKVSEVIKRLSRGYYEVVMRLLCGYYEVIMRLSWGYNEVIMRLLWRSFQSSNRIVDEWGGSRLLHSQNIFRINKKISNIGGQTNCLMAL